MIRILNFINNEITKLDKLKILKLIDNLAFQSCSKIFKIEQRPFYLLLKDFNKVNQNL